MKDAEGIVYRRVLSVCAAASKAERHSVGWGKGAGGLYASLIMCKCVLVCVCVGRRDGQKPVRYPVITTADIVRFLARACAYRSKNRNTHGFIAA